MKKHLWRRLTLAILSASLVLGITLVQPAPVAAYRNLGYGFSSDLVTVCIDSNDFGSSSRRATIMQGAYTWDAVSDLLVYIEVRAGCGSWGNVQVIKDDTTNPLRTTITTSCSIFGCHIEKSIIRLDPSYGGPELFWGRLIDDPNQQCYVNNSGSGCDPDAYTLFTHEFGHAFGMFENQATVTEECTSGWFSTNTSQACSTIGKKMMYGQAGIEKQSSNPDLSSGYRRTELTFDDKEGMRDLYGG